MRTLSPIIYPALGGLALLSMTLTSGCGSGAGSDAGSEAGTMTTPVAGTMTTPVAGTMTTPVAGTMTTPVAGAMTPAGTPPTSAEVDALLARVTMSVAPANDGMTALCGRCMDINTSCGEELFPSPSAEEATCMLTATPEERAALDAYIACEEMYYAEFKSCVDAIMDCSADSFDACLEPVYYLESCMQLDNAYGSRINVECFGGEPDFTCGDGATISGDWVCDGQPDCADSSDEPSTCPPPFACADGGGDVPASWRCDGGEDCEDGSDEVGCMP